MACQKKLRLATCESCTGGLVASLLTDVQGLSHAFDRGLIVYTPEAKSEMLGLSLARIENFGAVSQMIERDIAWATLRVSHADVAVAITGNAGKGRGVEDVGLVYVAAAHDQRGVVDQTLRLGDIGRTAIRNRAAFVALSLLYAMLRDQA